MVTPEPKNPKETMTTIECVQHPFNLRGRARRFLLGLWLIGTYWSTFATISLERIILVLAAATAATAASAALTWAARRLLWRAWAEVPGAWRSYPSQAAADAASPSDRLDLLISAAQSIFLAGAGVVIVATSLDGFAMYNLFGLVGGMMGVIAVVDLAVASWRKGPRYSVWAIRLLPAIAWSSAGFGGWVLVGALIALVTYPLFKMARP